MTTRVQLRVDPTVPNEGWVCVDFSSLADRSAPCGWCGVHRLRHVHTLVHPNRPEVVRVATSCAQRMGDAEAYAREKLFKQYPQKARTLLEIEIQLRRVGLSPEVQKYLTAAHKRLKYASATRRSSAGPGDEPFRGLESKDAAVLAEVLGGLKSGRLVEQVLDRWRSSISEEYAGWGIPRRLSAD